MIAIVGLVVLLVAVIVGFTGVLTNAGAAHSLTENFSLFGYHVTGSTGTLFLSGIVVGAVAMLGLSVLLAGARRTAGRGRQSARTAKVATRNGVSEPGTRPTARTPAGQRGQWRCGQPAASADPPQQDSAARSLLARPTINGHRPCRRTPVGPGPRPMRSARSRGPVITENEGIRNEHR
jgi:hypothetical protein